MKKLNTILAALGALLMLSATSANSVEFKAGLSVNGMAAYANAKETLKDGGTRTTNEEAVLATSFESLFFEVSMEEIMGLGIGVSYAPKVVDLKKETRNIQDTVPQTGLGGLTNDTGSQIISGKINDLRSIYLTLPIGENGAFVKGGYMQADLITDETLATGSAYANIELDGTYVGAGYEGSLGDMVFWRAEGTYQMWQDITATGSEVGGTAGSFNKITAELGSVTGSLSVGMKF
jgi:hypothetical protein